MNDCHPVVEQMKAEYMDFLYKEAGRDKSEHPMKGLYTGLWQEHQEVCAQAARQAWWDCRQVDPEAFDR